MLFNRKRSTAGIPEHARYKDLRKSEYIREYEGWYGSERRTDNNRRKNDRTGRWRDIWKTVEGTEDYYNALAYFNNILDNYGSFTYTNKKGKEVVVNVDEKRIITPSIIVVKNGVAIAKESGFNNEEECVIKEKYNCLLDKWNSNEPVVDPTICDLTNVCTTTKKD